LIHASGSGSPQPQAFILKQKVPIDDELKNLAIYNEMVGVCAWRHYSLFIDPPPNSNPSLCQFSWFLLRLRFASEFDSSFKIFRTQ